VQRRLQNDIGFGKEINQLGNPRAGVAQPGEKDLRRARAGRRPASRVLHSGHYQSNCRKVGRQRRVNRAGASALPAFSSCLKSSDTLYLVFIEYEHTKCCKR
jgi:hypothetical protein